MLNYGINVIDIDEIKLRNLGFSEDEIIILNTVLSHGNKVTTNVLMAYGLNYAEANKIKYMYDISAGKVNIEDPSITDNMDSLAKHAKKMFGNFKKLDISDLAVSKIKAVPRTAVISGIPKGPFDILNSKQYKPLERLYTVEDVSSKRITISTNRIPVLKYGQSKNIDGVLEVIKNPKNGIMKVAIDKEFIRLTNRFIVVASLRRPEFHLGMVEILCIEGSKLYVYVKDIGTNKEAGYRMGTQRVYDYGFFPNEIGYKLTACANELYGRLLGVYAKSVHANQDYTLLSSVEEVIADEIVIE